jgi:hypothetical protein
MATRLLTRSKRTNVTDEALDRNVEMQQLAMDLVAKQSPGYTILVLVSAASNKDLGLREHVKREHNGHIYSRAPSSPNHEPKNMNKGHLGFEAIFMRFRKRHSDQRICSLH